MPVNRIYLLENETLDYEWGSDSFIPELLGKTPPFVKPQAEMWMGSHKKAPSRVVVDDIITTLDLLIEKYPQDILGATISEKFSGELPFLFKVLSASKPLSIQAHPDKTQAGQGFNRENSAGIEINAPQRNYRDINHKPEMICALTGMWALKGFRNPEEILALFEPLKGISGRCGIDILINAPNETGIKNFFLNLLNMDKADSQILTKDIRNAVQPLRDENPAYEWVIKLNQEYPGDPGALAPLYLNVLKLDPGETIFLPACELHAYLSGSGLEIMANSDNVLRGGLTKKHIDKKELMDVLRFFPEKPEILKGKKSGFFETLYHSPAEEFILSVINLPEEGSLYKNDGQRSVEIILCTEGRAEITDVSANDHFILRKGVSMLIPAAVEGYTIKGKATIYKASVPL